MANKSITERGLMLYYTSLDEIKKIDSTELGELIKRELEWMSGKSPEPEFDDVRCDIFHMHLKEQIAVRAIATGNHKPNGDDGKQSKPPQMPSTLPTCDLTSEEKMGLNNIETEAKATQPAMNVIPKVGIKDERLQEWVFGMKDNPDDGKLFSKWIWFFKNRDEAVYWLSTH